jgi:hypothetical protein
LTGPGCGAEWMLKAHPRTGPDPTPPIFSHNSFPKPQPYYSTCLPPIPSLWLLYHPSLLHPRPACRLLRPLPDRTAVGPILLGLLVTLLYAPTGLQRTTSSSNQNILLRGRCTTLVPLLSLPPNWKTHSTNRTTAMEQVTWLLKRSTSMERRCPNELRSSSLRFMKPPRIGLGTTPLKQLMPLDPCRGKVVIRSEVQSNKEKRRC